MKFGTVIGILVGCGSLVAMTVGGINYFESSAHAETSHNVISGDREIGDLRTRKELIEIKIQRYKDLADVRPLTESEVIDLRSLQRELSIVLGRLSDLGQF